MANGMYDAGREAFATGAINWTSADIRTILIDAADYTVDLVNHSNLSDVAAGARVATMGASMAGKSATDGILDATDVVFSSVTGDQSEAVIIYYHTGVEGTSTLLFYIDSGTGFPVTPNTGDITIAWSDGANKIAKL